MSSVVCRLCEGGPEAYERAGLHQRRVHTQRPFLHQDRGRQCSARAQEEDAPGEPCQIQRLPGEFISIHSYVSVYGYLCLLVFSICGSLSTYLPIFMGVSL